MKLTTGIDRMDARQLLDDLVASYPGREVRIQTCFPHEVCVGDVVIGWPRSGRRGGKAKEVTVARVIQREEPH